MVFNFEKAYISSGKKKAEKPKCPISLLKYYLKIS